MSDSEYISSSDEEGEYELDLDLSQSEVEDDEEEEDGLEGIEDEDEEDDGVDEEVDEEKEEEKDEEEVDEEDDDGVGEDGVDEEDGIDDEGSDVDDMSGDEEGSDDDNFIMEEEEKVVPLTTVKKEYNVTNIQISNIKNGLCPSIEVLDSKIEKLLQSFTTSVKNIEILKRNIYTATKGNKENLLSMCFFLIHCKQNGIELKIIQKHIKESYRFSLSEWEEASDDIKKDILKLKTPIEVEEGIFVCGKCGQNRTLSWSAQLRRADEPPTVFVTCMNKECKNKWRIG